MKNKQLNHNSETFGKKNLDTYSYRLRNVRLNWCKQVMNIITDAGYKNKKNIKINDLGCNYFQLFKEIKHRKVNYDYFGYDIDRKFVNLGLEYFPELNKKVKIINIENHQPRKCNISVTSATLEHSENPNKFLNNMFSSTSEMVILRTFLGQKDVIKLYKNKRVVSNPYLINQFSFEMIINKFLKNNFIPSIYLDEATNKSRAFEVNKGSGINRSFFIIVGTKLIS
jgi:hypothetical protein